MWVYTWQQRVTRGTYCHERCELFQMSHCNLTKKNTEEYAYSCHTYPTSNDLFRYDKAIFPLTVLWALFINLWPFTAEPAFDARLVTSS